MEQIEARRGTLERCAGARCIQSRRRPSPGLNLCRMCRDGLADDLARLALLYHECGLLLGGSSQRPVRDKISGSRTQGIPFNSTAADVRAAIVTVLATWSGLVAQERMINAPKRIVSALVNFLTLHADWLASHEVASDVTNELRALVRRAGEAADSNRTPRIAVGHCVEIGCAGHLVAIMRPEGTPLPQEIGCDQNPAHRWPSRTWTRLSKQVSQQVAPQDARAAIQWLSATDISALWRTPSGSVYRLASERGWRRLRRAGRTYYHDADVEETFRDRA
jgi:hypothetical protein